MYYQIVLKSLLLFNCCVVLSCRMSCGICSAPMSLEDVLSNCVLLSYSQAWQLGRVILRIRAVGGMTVVDAVAEQQKGTVLLIGKVRKQI